MTKEAFYDMPKGTRLLAGSKFVEGEDPDVTPFFDKVITFDYFEKDKWVYFKELPTAPFHCGEIVCIAEDMDIDKDKQYEPGDMGLIFGGVSI